jgi:hypothetical protein
VGCLPNNTYRITPEHVKILKRKRIPFKKLAILGFLWRSIHHGGHEGHEENSWAQNAKSEKTRKCKPFVDFALFVVSQSVPHVN